jgi:hypothetical protein
VIKIGDSSRYEDLIKEHFYNLELVNLLIFSLEELLENTASEKLHIWYPDDPKKKPHEQKLVESFDIDDVQLAIKSHERGGASLYFGSPVEFRETYNKQLANQLGMNFTSYYPDFSSMSETE